ncbi:ribonuclease P [bacterium BMS3Bbin03]|nr:ribonuclease P [bacterium BMS3Bbin03]
MINQKLRKKDILRGKASYDEIFTSGRKAKGRRVTLFWVSSEKSQMGVAVSRHYKRAVDRNRMKRYIREIYRKNRGWFEKKKWFFIFAKQKKIPAIGISIMIFQI